MNRRKWPLGLAWLIVLGWMLLIFMFSAQPAEQSSELSGGIVEALMDTVEKITASVEIDASGLEHLVRKNAHFFVYLVLGTLSMNAFRRSGYPVGRAVASALALCVLYAVSDELHQLFVPGRSAQVTDVLIDSAGALTGIGLYRLLILTKRKG